MGDSCSCGWRGVGVGAEDEEEAAEQVCVWFLLVKKALCGQFLDPMGCG